MRIAVYDVAAESGGALSVLMEYYNNAVADKDNEYLFVVGLVDLEETSNVRVLRVPFVKRSWLHRILYDTLFAHRVMNSFRADRIISLQNVIVPFCGIQQYVYMHNLLPRVICDTRFGFSESPKLWVYQNIIGWLIISSCLRANGVIVQAQWIKDRLVTRCGIANERITIKRPSASPIVSLPNRKCTDITTFFYPASPEPFKNHEVIVRACELLKQEGIDGYRVVFTLRGDESKHIKAMSIRANVESLPIEFMGWLTHDKMSEMYSESDCLLFPSEVETFGLPLLEAKASGINIIASNLEYARETIGNYPNVVYFDPKDANCLKQLLEIEISKHE